MLLLLVVLLKLHEYAPTCIVLMKPPCEFAPKENISLVLETLHLEHADLLTCTVASLAEVAPHMLLLLEV